MIRTTISPGIRGILTGLSLLLIVLAAPASASEFPLASTGDIWFQADHAGFLGDDGQIIEEYYFKVLNNQIQFEPGDEGFTGRVFVHLKFKTEEGDDLAEASHQYDFIVPDEASATSADFSQLLLLRENLDPRTRLVEVEVEDLNARKRGILYMFTGKRKNGRATGRLELPPFVGQDFGLSDIQFAWEFSDKDTEGPFVKNGLEIIPNPSRNYGLLQARLTAYYEVYDRRPDRGGDVYIVNHSLVDHEGQVIPTSPDTVRSESGEWVKITSFDVSKLRTGEYELRAVVRHPESGAEAVSGRSFNVLWKNEQWATSEQDILDEARVLFDEKEYDRFKEMSSGDRASYIEKFWLDADPTPTTGVNELRREFLKRVEYANRQFHDQRKGMLTDRGRIYIRFGEPDEVVREIMPTQDRQLDQQVRDLEEENIAGSMLATNDVFDTRPYEIWLYTRQGTPLFPEREATTTVTGLRFVFVDETGTGHYVLRYSSDFIGY